MRILALITGCLALAACETVTSGGGAPTGPAVPPAADDTCDAGEYAALVGQDATALERVLIMRPVRVIRPNTAITMDFSPARINFSIGENNRIIRIWCG